MEAEGNQHSEMGTVNPFRHRHISSHRVSDEIEGVRHTYGYTYCPIIYQYHDHVAHRRALYLPNCSMFTCNARKFTHIPLDPAAVYDRMLMNRLLVARYCGDGPSFHQELDVNENGTIGKHRAWSL